MDWWLIVLFALAGLGVLSGGFFGILRATKGLRQSLGTITSALNDAVAANNEPPKPRSLSSLESVAMPKILKDFPDFNARVFSQRVRRDAETYYQSGMEQKMLFKNSLSVRIILTLCVESSSWNLIRARMSDLGTTGWYWLRVTIQMAIIRSAWKQYRHMKTYRRKYSGKIMN